MKEILASNLGLGYEISMVGGKSSSTQEENEYDDIEYLPYEAIKFTVINASCYLANQFKLQFIPFLKSLREDELMFMERSLYKPVDGKDGGDYDNNVKFGSFSTEGPGDYFPKQLVNADTGRVGIIVCSHHNKKNKDSNDEDGYHHLPREFSVQGDNGGVVYLFEIVVLYPEELQEIITGGTPKRMEILHHIKKLKNSHNWCSLDGSLRPSVALSS